MSNKIKMTNKLIFSINPKKTIFYGKCEKCGKCEEKNK